MQLTVLKRACGVLITQLSFMLAVLWITRFRNNKMKNYFEPRQRFHPGMGRVVEVARNIVFHFSLPSNFELLYEKFSHL